MADDWYVEQRARREAARDRQTAPREASPSADVRTGQEICAAYARAHGFENFEAALAAGHTYGDVAAWVMNQ